MTLPQSEIEELRNSDVHISGRERLHDGYRKIDRYSFTHRTMNPDADEWLPVMNREMCRMSEASVVLLYHPESDSVLLSRQFRLGAVLRNEDDPFMIECAAGCVDDDETPEQAARRESFEETGAEIVDLEYIGHSFPSAGSTDEECYFYCARIAKIPEERYHGLAEEGEEIETFTVKPDEIAALLDEDQVHNSNALILLNWFLRHHARLRKKWS
ncbi:MAG: NUDIX hydrolase [Pseudomonadota bacterium]|nr:NUDIX hydrolase [Pseudomonadota bacterium]QKK05821.1 MAG: NUDIX hydrolase [Pseudomonadota bacterium]|tara:strand:- start:266 stop:907 length:642 start_codon:yes stop_codon:yes gene_type:complete